MINSVVFNTWSGAFFNPGGGEVQLTNSKLHLEKKGIQVELYDQWAPQKGIALLHQFSIAPGVEHVIREYKNGGGKVALSTILWDELPKESYLYHHIREIMCLSDILFTNSDAESQKLSKGFEIPIEKFHKTRNAIPDDYIIPAKNNHFREEFNISDDFILSVANIDTRKNTFKLVEACQELNKNLVLIGHVRDSDYFNKIQSQFSNFNYLGPISNTDLLKSAYKECSLFALPSLCETPGIAALEAASQGAKIVITNEGPTAEYFGENNISLVDPSDLHSIISGIERELSMARSSELSELIAKEYTWDKTADDIIAGYQKIHSLT